MAYIHFNPANQIRIRKAGYLMISSMGPAVQITQGIHTIRIAAYHSQGLATPSFSSSRIFSLQNLLKPLGPSISKNWIMRTANTALVVGSIVGGIFSFQNNIFLAIAGRPILLCIADIAADTIISGVSISLGSAIGIGIMATQPILAGYLIGTGISIALGASLSWLKEGLISSYEQKLSTQKLKDNGVSLNNLSPISIT